LPKSMNKSCRSWSDHEWGNPQT